MCRQKPAGKTIGEVEKLTGIPKRMLKYYIERKIIVPECKSVSGYWLYTDEDVEKLRLVSLCREMQFPDSEIRTLIAAPTAVDWQAVVDRQIDRLAQRRSRAEDRLLTAELVRYRCRTGRAPGSEAGPPASRLEALFVQGGPGRPPRLPEDARRALCRDLYGTFAEAMGVDRPPVCLPAHTDTDPAASAMQAHAAALCALLRQKEGLSPEEVLFALRLALCLSGMELLLDVVLGRKGAVRSLAGAVQVCCDTQSQS